MFFWLNSIPPEFGSVGTDNISKGSIFIALFGTFSVLSAFFIILLCLFEEFQASYWSKVRVASVLFLRYIDIILKDVVGFSV